MKILFTIGLLFTVNCTTVLITPPVRTIASDSSATLPYGRTAVAVEGGAGASAFTDTIAAGAVRVRHGVDVEGKTDLLAEASGLTYSTGDHALSLFGGVKRSLAGKYLAATAGIGAGFSGVHPWSRNTSGDLVKAGDLHMTGHAGVDIGLIAAYENPTLVPFGSVRGFVSTPFGANKIALPDSDGFDELELFQMKTTWGWIASAGLRIPAIHGNDYDKLSLVAAASGGMITDFASDYLGFWTIHGGLEFGL